jgi:hypothetical protein
VLTCSRVRSDGFAHRGTIIEESRSRARLGVAPRSDQEQRELEMDIAREMASLPRDGRLVHEVRVVAIDRPFVTPAPDPDSRRNGTKENGRMKLLSQIQHGRTLAPRRTLVYGVLDRRILCGGPAGETAHCPTAYPGEEVDR